MLSVTNTTFDSRTLEFFLLQFLFSQTTSRFLCTRRLVLREVLSQVQFDVLANAGRRGLRSRRIFLSVAELCPSSSFGDAWVNRFFSDASLDYACGLDFFAIFAPSERDMGLRAVGILCDCGCGEDAGVVLVFVFGPVCASGIMLAWSLESAPRGT